MDSATMNLFGITAEQAGIATGQNVESTETKTEEVSPTDDSAETSGSMELTDDTSTFSEELTEEDSEASKPDPEKKIEEEEKVEMSQKERELEKTILGLKASIETMMDRIDKAEEANRRLLEKLVDENGLPLIETEDNSEVEAATKQQYDILKQMKMMALSVPQYRDLNTVLSRDAYEDVVSELTREAMKRSNQPGVAKHREAVENYLWTTLPREHGKNPFIVLYEMLKPSASSHTASPAPANGADKKQPARGIAGVGSAGASAGSDPIAAKTKKLMSMTPQDMVSLPPGELSKLLEGV